MILKLQTCVLFNSLFLYTCFDIIKMKSNFPDSENYIDESNAVGDPNVLRFFKKIGSYKNYTTKILVKKVVPHGTAATSLEYDYKFKTLYKPLIRIHKSKAIENEIKTKENNNQYNEIKDPKLENSDEKDILNTDELLEPFNTNANNNINLKVLHSIHNSIKGMDSQSNRIKANDEVIYLLKDMLRSPKFEKSGEANDPLAPGKAVNEFDELDDRKKKTKKWIPHYPPWNYWTYKKPIHEDVCPGMQVKIGNMCIWIPPH